MYRLGADVLCRYMIADKPEGPKLRNIINKFVESVVKVS